MTTIHDPNDDSRINDIVDQIIDEHAQKVAAQSLRTVTHDEQVFTQCLAFYDALTKSTLGFLHRDHVNTLVWMLGHASDAALRQCADTLEPGAIMDNPKACFARISEVILRKRHKGRVSVGAN